MKTIRPKPYLDKYKGHKQSILKIYSPHGPQGSLLYSISTNGELFVWDTAEKVLSKEFLLKLPQTKYQDNETRKINYAQFSGNILYTGLLDGSVYSWSIQTADLIDKFIWHKEPVNHIQKINNRVLLTAGKQGRINLWDTISGNLDKSYQFKNSITSISYKQPLLTVVSNRKTIHLLDLQTNNFLYRKQSQLGRYIIKVFQYKGQTLIQMSDFMLECYKSLESNLVWKLSLNNTWINTIKMVKQYIVCGCEDGSIRLINEKNNQLVDNVKGHQLPINSLDLAFGKFFTASSDFCIMSWDIQQFENKLRQTKIMQREELESRKYETYMKMMIKNKKKKKSGKSKSKSKTKTKASKSVKKR